jgi:nickel/cobalt transporter (NiCoT) family protein
VDINFDFQSLFASVSLSASLTTLALLCLVIGARHGLDPDHLATIDALTRLGRVKNRLLAGLLFSLGHGAVVTLAAVAVQSLGHRQFVPTWFEMGGTLVSAVLLIGLGSLNLWAILQTPAGQRVQLQAVNTYGFGRYLGLSQKLAAPLLAGALMAFSFDTLSLALLLPSASAAQSTLTVLILCIAFTVGMAISDGLNGWLFARILQRSDAVAATASRVMTMAVVALSYGVAALALARLNFDMASWTPVAIVLILLLTFALGHHVRRLDTDINADTKC